MRQSISAGSRSTAIEPWQLVEVHNLLDLRRKAALRYGVNGQAWLTVMADKYQVRYSHLGETLNARLALYHIVKALAEDFSLSPKQVITCWPILRSYPRQDLEERAMRRAG